MKNCILAVATISALSFGAATTSALNTIDGSLLIVGSGSASVSAGVTTVVPGSPMSVAIGLGDYAGIPAGSPVIVNPFSYTGTGLGSVLQAAVTPEWTVTIGAITYSFDLTALQSATFVPGIGNTPSSIAVSGSGIAHGTGYLDTAASWSFSATGTGFTFAVGSEATTAIGTPFPPESTPDGGSTLVLIGVAMGGIAAARRKS